MQLKADDCRDEHRKRLAEHGSFGFDSAYSPAENAEAIHHRRMGIGANQRVWKGNPLAILILVEDHAREIF